MPLFEYKAISAEGRALKGVIDAENAKAARLKLRKQGVFATDVNQGGGAAAEKSAALAPGLIVAWHRETQTTSARDWLPEK